MLSLTNVLTLDQPEYTSFTSYLRAQKNMLLAGGVVAVLLYFLLKFLFPFPDFFVDSFTYVEDAVDKVKMGYRPEGYSDFLRTVHGISPDVNLVALIQYSFFALTSIFCFCSCDYLFSIPEKLRKLAFFLVLVNPVLIFQTNLISSDSLFCSLTVLWFTLCLWAVKKQSIPAMVLQAAVLYGCFQIRYTAVFYPVIPVIMFIFSRRKIWYRLLGVAITLGVAQYVSVHKKEVSESLIKTDQAPGFSGWQIANNVLCYYRSIDVSVYDLPTAETKEIDRYVNHFLDTIYEKNYVGTKYMWDQKSPLKQYLMSRVVRTKHPYCVEWYLASEAMNDYGWAIVKNNPMAYLRYFVVPNFKMFFYPEREALTNYNFWNTAIPKKTKTWYGLNFDNLHCRFPLLQRRVICVYPAISLLLNLINIGMIFLLLWKYIKVGRKGNREALSLFISWCIFYFGYMAFCIGSTIVLLRYVDPLFVLGTVMPFVLLYQYKVADKQQAEEVAPAPVSKQPDKKVKPKQKK